MLSLIPLCAAPSVFLGELEVLDQAANGEVQADNTHDVVPGVLLQGEEVRGDADPHIAPGVEGDQRNADEHDVQPQAVALARAPLLMCPPKVGHKQKHYVQTI